MVATLVNIEEYDPKREEWPQYVERLKSFFRGQRHCGHRQEKSSVPIGGGPGHIQTPSRFVGSREARRQL